VSLEAFASTLAQTLSQAPIGWLKACFNPIYQLLKALPRLAFSKMQASVQPFKRL
jgi:hypothetical protein